MASRPGNKKRFMGSLRRRGANPAKSGVRRRANRALAAERRKAKKALAIERRKARKARAQHRRQQRKAAARQRRTQRAHERRTLWEDARNLPNLLTFLRILMIPAVLVLLERGGPKDCYWAAVVYSLAAVTDLLDGWLARRSGLSAPRHSRRRPR